MKPGRGETIARCSHGRSVLNGVRRTEGPHRPLGSVSASGERESTRCVHGLRGDLSHNRVCWSWTCRSLKSPGGLGLPLLVLGGRRAVGISHKVIRCTCQRCTLRTAQRATGRRLLPRRARAGDEGHEGACYWPITGRQPRSNAIKVISEAKPIAFAFHHDSSHARPPSTHTSIHPVLCPSNVQDGVSSTHLRRVLLAPRILSALSPTVTRFDSISRD